MRGPTYQGPRRGRFRGHRDQVPEKVDFALHAEVSKDLSPGNAAFGWETSDGVSTRRPGQMVVAPPKLHLIDTVCVPGSRPLPSRPPSRSPSPPLSRRMASSTAPRPSPLACDECRRKHLKCDGATPRCGRCAANDLICVFTPSRRGLGRHIRRAGRLARTVSATPSSPPTPLDLAPCQLLNPWSTTASGPIDAGVAAALTVMPASPTPCVLPALTRERLLGLFYTQFYQAHPFLVPRAFYPAQDYPYYLDLVVCSIGQHYAHVALEEMALAEAVSHAMSSPDETTPHRVQALVLYAIVLHARHQPRDAELCIARAAKLAVEQGMNEPSFAQAHAAGSWAAEESLRRTWWELYTVDMYLAAIHRRSTSETSAVQTLPMLPRTWSLVEMGGGGAAPPSLRSFDDRVFIMEPQLDFSSYCYRIDAIRIVGRVLALAAVDDAHPDDVQALDNALVSWEYNLPPLRTDVVDPSGEVDQMLFQARCFISCASIFLHFPRSDLPATVPSFNDIACAKDYTPLAPTSRHHAIKAVAASKALANLATVPCSLERHSPFFICGLTLGCIIQLAAGAMHLHQCGLDCLQQHRDRIVLMLGALRRLGEKWALAQHALRRLKVMAETVLSTRGGDDAPKSDGSSLHDSAVDAGEASADLAWFDLFSFGDVQSDLFNV